MTQKLASCSLCGGEILAEDVRHMHRQIVVWESTQPQKTRRRQRLRRETGAVAHGPCVERGDRRVKAGLDPHQEGLF